MNSIFIHLLAWDKPLIDLWPLFVPTHYTLRTRRTLGVLIYANSAYTDEVQYSSSGGSNKYPAAYIIRIVP